MGGYLNISDKPLIIIWNIRDVGLTLFNEYFHVEKMASSINMIYCLTCNIFIFTKMSPPHLINTQAILQS